MQYYLGLFFKVFLLRVPPQDVPASRSLLVFALLSMYIAGCAGTSFLYSIPLSLLINLFDAVFLLVFIYLLLKFYNLVARFWQAATAFCALIFSYYVLQLPASTILHSQLLDASNVLVDLAKLYTLLLVLYYLCVFTITLSKALSVHILLALALTIVFFVVNYQLMVWVLPAQGNS